LSATAWADATEAIDADLTAAGSSVGVADVAVVGTTGTVLLVAAGVAVPAMVQAVRAIAAAIATAAAGSRAVMVRFTKSPLMGSMFDVSAFDLSAGIGPPTAVVGG
jgi:hypothetical protein